MNTNIVHHNAMIIDADPVDHSAAMQADPGQYGFTREELKILTPEEMRIGMTKAFLHARAEVRLQQAKKRRLPGSLSPVC